MKGVHVCAILTTILLLMAVGLIFGPPHSVPNTVEVSVQEIKWSTDGNLSATVQCDQVPRFYEWGMRVGWSLFLTTLSCYFLVVTTMLLRKGTSRP